MSKQIFLACMAMVFTGLMVSCKRELATSLHEESLSPAKDGAKISTTLAAKNGPLGVCYVEVNSNNLLNVGCYTLKNGGEQLFDIAIIFASNINYDVAQQRAVLFHNPNVTTVLSNRNTYIKPLQDKGIKVLLSILGNHQGAGVCNFTSRAKARDFALQLSNAVTTYGLDGIDFDDEYANYGANGTGQPNDSSFVFLVSELRSLMPDKIISFYYFGPATSRQSWNGQRVGDLVNYSWNAIYGSFSVPNVPGLTAPELGPAAAWVSNTSATTAKNLAQQTINNGYGIYLYYDLHNNNESNWLSAVSTTLYNDSTVVTPGCLQSWPPTNNNGVVFYQHINYGGTASQPLAPGNYTLSQLQALGFVNDWASSVRVPAGRTLTMYSNDNFGGTSWVRTSDTPDFTVLSPNANDVVSSISIQ